MTSLGRTKFQDVSLSLLRIVGGLLFAQHGAQKLLGWFGGVGDGGTVELLSRFGVAGSLELVGGVLVMVGLFTRPVAFVLSGEMAVAYFWVHQSQAVMPIQNGGELAALYAFVFLAITAFGPGSISLDELRGARASAAAGAGATPSAGTAGAASRPAAGGGSGGPGGGGGGGGGPSSQPGG